VAPSPFGTGEGTCSTGCCLRRKAPAGTSELTELGSNQEPTGDALALWERGWGEGAFPFTHPWFPISG